MVARAEWRSDGKGVKAGTSRLVGKGTWCDSDGTRCRFPITQGLELDTRQLRKFPHTWHAVHHLMWRRQARWSLYAASSVGTFQKNVGSARLFKLANNLPQMGRLFWPPRFVAPSLELSSRYVVLQTQRCANFSSCGILRRVATFFRYNALPKVRVGSSD